MVETEIINEELTKGELKRRKHAVEPIRILQGQVIVREGQVIDDEIYSQLELLGLLTNQSSVKPMAALILFVLLISSVIYMHFKTWRENAVVKKKSLSYCAFVFLLQVIIDETYLV